MRVDTQIVDVNNLFPTLAPIILNGESVLTCLQLIETSEFNGGEEMTSYVSIVLTQARLIYGYGTLEKGERMANLRDATNISEISKVKKRYTDKDHIPQLVINLHNGKEFLRIDFSSEYMMDTFIRALRTLNLVVELT